MRKPNPLILFVVVVLVWSTTWTAMSIAVETIPPVTATGLRFLVASPLLILLLSMTRAPLFFPPGERWLQIAISVGYFIIPFTLLIWGEQKLSPGLAALLSANMPVVVLFLSIAFLNEKLCLIRFLGLFLSIISLILILRRELSPLNVESVLGLFAFLVALMLLGFVNIQLKKRYCAMPALTFNTLPCALAGILLSGLALILENPSFNDFSAKSISAVIYLAVFANVVAVISFFKLQQVTSPSRASIVFAIFPLLAIAIDGFRYGHTLTISSIALLIPLSVGLIIVAYSPRSTTDKPIMDQHNAGPNSGT